METETETTSVDTVRHRAACENCGGSGYEPHADFLCCLPCGGTGYAQVAGDLGPTRSRKSRPYSYQPGPAGCGVLTLTEGVRNPVKIRYLVEEFTPDGAFPGRAFRLTKAGGPDVYSVFLCADGHGNVCDCAGKSYEATAKADQRAWERREAARVGRSLGCKHLDALLTLLRGGHLEPEADVPDIVSSADGPLEGADPEPPIPLPDPDPDPADVPVWVGHGEHLRPTKTAPSGAGDAPGVSVAGIGLEGVEFLTPDRNAFFDFETLRPGECWPLPDSLWTVTLHAIDHEVRGGRALVSLTYGPPF